MAENTSGGAVRRFVIRTLAAGALVVLYVISTITLTGLTLSSSTTTADAQGRGGGGGGGRGGGGGGRGGGGRGGGGGGRGGGGGLTPFYIAIKAHATSKSEDEAYDHAFAIWLSASALNVIQFPYEWLEDWIGHPAVLGHAAKQ
jgi:hypothetical protein